MSSNLINWNSFQSNHHHQQEEQQQHHQQHHQQHQQEQYQQQQPQDPNISDSVFESMPNVAKNVTKNVVVTETSHRDLSIEDKKTLGQISAAKRSVITNVVVVAVTFCVNVVMTLPVVSKDLLPFLSVITFSSIKGLLPILTTLANFGTTNNLMHQYWCELKETIKN